MLTTVLLDLDLRNRPEALLEAVFFKQATGSITTRGSKRFTTVVTAACGHFLKFNFIAVNVSANSLKHLTFYIFLVIFLVFPHTQD